MLISNNIRLKRIKKTSILFFTLILFSLSPVLADDLPSVTSSAETTCTDQTFTTVTSVVMDVTSINAVYIGASFTTKMASGTTTRTGYYKIITSGGSPTFTSSSGEISRRLVSVGGSDDKGIGSLVHIFDVSSVTGSVTFTFQHKNGESGELITTAANLVAIGLTTVTGTQHLDYDVQRIEAGSLAVDTTWTTVCETAAITNPSGANLFIASSINTKKDNTPGTADGEWKLQYKQGASGTWFDMGVSMSRSFADENTIGMTGTVSVMENQSSADFYFRLLNRLANLASDYVGTFNTNLVAFTLGTPSDGKTFPVYKVEGGPAATTSTSMVTALTKSITPSNAASLYLHAQYSMSASAASNAPAFDLYVDNSIYDGLDQYRAISGSGSTGSGMSVGLANGLSAYTTYNMSLRHLSSSSGITLTTDNIALIGIQLSHNADITWDGSESTDWNTGENWDGGSVPGSSDNVIIPNVTNDPAVTGTRTCYDLNLATGAVLTVSGSGDLTVRGNLTNQGTVTVSATLGVSGSMNVQGGTLTINNPGAVTIANNLTTTGTVNVNKTLTVSGNTTIESGKLTVNSPGNYTVSGDYLWISGGEFELNDGTVTSTNEFWSSTGSTVDINGGTLDIGSNWGNNAGKSAKGTIELSGGNITVGDDAKFSSSSSLIGSMSGSFSLTIGDNFHNNSSNWGTPTGGTITMTASKDGGCILYSSNASNDVVAYNLTIDGSGGAFWIYKGGGENQGLHVFNDFTVTNGTVHTLGSTEHMDKLDVDGTFSLAAGAEFRDAIESTGDTYSVNAYSFNSTSTYRFYSDEDQNIPATTFGHVKIRGTGTKSITGSTTIAGNLSITAGELIVPAGKDLTVSGNLTNSSTMTVNSSATANGSFMLAGTSSGNITYNRYMTGGSSPWHLIAAPVGAQDINSFVVTDVATNAIATKGSNYGLAPYNNITPAWTYYTTSTISGAGPFEAGKGYEVLRTSDGTVSFTGTVATGDVGIVISTPTSPGTPWNLVGNPYPSAICYNTPASDATSATENLILKNTSVLDAGAYQAMYMWDANAGTPEYTTINHSSGAIYVAPGQAFFVHAGSGGGTFNFTEAMQTHQTGDIFKSSSSPIPAIKLFAQSTERISSTNIKYIENMTTGLDPGYDGGRFTGGSNSFAIYTHLVGDMGNDIDFDIQCLPSDEYDHVIPVGLNLPENTEVVFSAHVMNLPSDILVILEDKTTGIFTSLNEEGSNYTIKLLSPSHGVGRFFLHTQAQSTGINNQKEQSEVNIISSPQNGIVRITGIITEGSQMTVYDMAGRQLLKHRLLPNEVNDVMMNRIESGIYLIQISSTTERISKKINWISQ